MQLYGSWPLALNGLSSTDSHRICRGPNRVPLRLEVPVSRGTPTKHASRPFVSPWTGSRMKDAMPPGRGMSLELSGLFSEREEVAEEEERDAEAREAQSLDEKLTKPWRIMVPLWGRDRY